MIRLCFVAALVLNGAVSRYLFYKEQKLPTFLPIITPPEINGELTGVALPCQFSQQISAADEWFAYDQKLDERASRCYRRV